MANLAIQTLPVVAWGSSIGLVDQFESHGGSEMMLAEKRLLPGWMCSGLTSLAPWSHALVALPRRSAPRSE
jgi:hypothetical protein